MALRTACFLLCFSAVAHAQERLLPRLPEHPKQKVDPRPVMVVPALPPVAAQVAPAPPPPRAEGPDEWAPMPTPTKDTTVVEVIRPEQAPAGAPVPTALERPQVIAAPEPGFAFINQVRAALGHGNCEAYHDGLDALAAQRPRTLKSETARVVSARCYRAELRPDRAMEQYRLYLQEYPEGPFTTEAKEALGQ